MATDMTLQQQVLQEMLQDDRIPQEKITVSVRDRVVTLRGTVEHEAQRSAAHRSAGRVLGVRGLVNEIVVRYPVSLAHADANVSMLVGSELDRHRDRLPADGIHVSVSAGWVRLTGTVGSERQRDYAERVVRAVEGVRGVTDELRVRAPAGTFTTVS